LPSFSLCSTITYFNTKILWEIQYFYRLDRSTKDPQNRSFRFLQQTVRESSNGAPPPAGHHGRLRRSRDTTCRQRRPDKGRIPPREAGCIVRGRRLLLDMVPPERSSVACRQRRCHRCQVKSYGALKHSCITCRSMLTPSPSAKSWSPVRSYLKNTQAEKDQPGQETELMHADIKRPNDQNSEHSVICNCRIQLLVSSH
jgi:hypothetical protein